MNTNLTEIRLVGGPKHGSAYSLPSTRIPDQITVPSHSLKLALEFSEIVGELDTQIDAVVYERDPGPAGYCAVIWYYWVPQKGEQLHGQDH